MKTSTRMTAAEPPKERHVLRWVVAGIAVLAVGLGVVVVLAIRSVAPPAFPSLAASPDASLKGTVAYVRDRPGAEWCLTVVSASGAHSKDLLCGTRDGSPESVRWRDDGKIALILNPTSPTAPRTGKIVDPATGVTTALPASEIPPVNKTEPAGSATRGDRTVTVTTRNGRTTLVLSGPSGERTLVSAPGSSNLYNMSTPVWSADGKWVVVYDSGARLLVVTVDEPSTTRILANDVRGMFDVSGTNVF